MNYTMISQEKNIERSFSKMAIAFSASRVGGTPV